MSTPTTAAGTAGTRRAERIITLVSALGAAQGVAIVTQIGATADAVGASAFGAGPTAQLVITLLSSVFLTVAITVIAVVVTGAAEVVLTGRLREIALRRLLGAPASEERRRVTSAVLRRALAGMAWGAVLGYGVSLAVLALGLGTSSRLHLTAAAMIPSPLVIIGLVAQVLATRAAVRRGTRGVLLVAPVTALRLSADADAAVPATFVVPQRASAATCALGVALLVVSVLASTRSAFAMLPAVLGGVVSFVGLVSYGPRFVPPLLGLLARALPRSLAATLARRTLLRHPERTSRAVLAVAAPVTVVTTFAVGIATFDRAVREHYAGWAAAGAAADVLEAVVAVVGVLAAFLFVTAGLALGNEVAFGAWLRRRETALLRVVGQPPRATRGTVQLQSLLLAATATVIGLVLGTAYGWLGAQSVFGAEARGHVVTPVVPWPAVVAAVAAVGLLTLAAAWAPVRSTLRQPPIRAYLAG